MDIRSGATLEGPAGTTVTIVDVIGRGGFGLVYSGLLSDGTPVAVKTVLTSALNDSELRAFQNEAKHAVEVVHPNVVRVLHVDDGEASTGRPPYLVMEFVDAGTLRGAIDRHKGQNTLFSDQELRAIFLQIAEGMVAVNARLVHRDLKPENVLVDSSGVLKIADFGLAKLADAATRSETFKGWGTRAYQAPEAFEGGPNTPAMDIYAGGVIFFELAALRQPIQPKAGDMGPLAWRNAHLLSPPLDIRTARPGLPLDLVQLIVQMLQKNPSRRPASWSQVVERLKQSAPPATAPDVTALVSKATATLVAESAAQSRAREERERREERSALLKLAFDEPLGVLRSLVEAFNTASAVSALSIRESPRLDFEVLGAPGHPRLVISASEIADHDIRPNGVVRMMATVQLAPVPQPVDANDVYTDRDSFGGFNLVYRVRNAEERYGTWTQFRFEISPLMRERSYPRWFALSLGELPRALALLNAMGVHQNEQRQLDDEWFKALLLQML
jgi:serine/threonine protein kinase